MQNSLPRPTGIKGILGLWIFAILLAFAADAFATGTKPFHDVSWRSTVPAWTASPTATMQVRWHRVKDVPQSEVRDGVCVIYAPDTNEQTLLAVDGLLKSCEHSGKASAAPAANDTVLLYWHRVDGETLEQRARDVFREQFARPFAGFYYRPDPSGACHIVTDVRYHAAGHELKHCLDGAFHDGKQRWYR